MLSSSLDQPVVRQELNAATQVEGRRSDREAVRSVVSGQVLEAATGLPVAGAMIDVVAANEPHPPLYPATTSGRFRTAGGRTDLRDGQGPVTSDATGRFSVPVERGRRSFIRAFAVGYLPAAYGQMWPGAPEGAVDAADGAGFDRVVVMWRYASVSGTVLQEDGAPASGVRVFPIPYSSVQPSAGALPLADTSSGITDGSGNYTLSRLPPGKYIIGVIASYTTLSKTSVDEIARAGGTRSDAARKLRLSGGVVPEGTQGLSIGDVLLQGPAGLPAKQDQGRIQAYRSTFYPGDASTMSLASVLHLSSGEARSNVMFHLSPVSVSSVSGVVTDANGPVTTAAVNLFAVQDESVAGAPAFPAATGNTDEHGRFTLLGVPAGEYEIQSSKREVASTSNQVKSVVRTAVRDGVVVEAGVVRPPTPPAASADRMAVGQLRISVGRGDVRDLTLVLSDAPRVIGHFEFSGDTTVSKLKSPDLLLARAFRRGGFERINVSDDGQFRSNALTPGAYVVSMNARSGWILSSAECDGVDGARTALRLREGDCTLIVNITNKPASIATEIDTSDGDRFGTVFIFPAGVQDWLMPGAQANRMRVVNIADRPYRVDLPSGDYLLAAVSSAVFDYDWREPEVLSALSGIATRVTVKAGERKPVRLKPVRLR